MQVADWMLDAEPLTFFKGAANHKS